MYRHFSAKQYRETLGLNPEYKIEATLCYGTPYEKDALTKFRKILERRGCNPQLQTLPHPFMRFAWQFDHKGENYWFMIGYGGAWISEYIHYASIFGSKKNILIGTCGGLKEGLQVGDFIVPSSSYAKESSATIFNRHHLVHQSDPELSRSLRKRLTEQRVRVQNGRLITCQAMSGETLDDVRKWSDAGYVGVEMEAATVFAVSRHFKVPAAAILYVGDNLIEGHTNLSEEYAAQARFRDRQTDIQMLVALDEILD